MKRSSTIVCKGAIYDAFWFTVNLKVVHHAGQLSETISFAQRGIQTNLSLIYLTVFALQRTVLHKLRIMLDNMNLLLSMHSFSIKWRITAYKFMDTLHMYGWHSSRRKTISTAKYYFFPLLPPDKMSKIHKVKQTSMGHL